MLTHRNADSLGHDYTYLCTFVKYIILVLVLIKTLVRCILTLYCFDGILNTIYVNGDWRVTFKEIIISIHNFSSFNNALNAGTKSHCCWNKFGK